LKYWLLRYSQNGGVGGFNYGGEKGILLGRGDRRKRKKRNKEEKKESGCFLLRQAPEQDEI